MTTVYLYRYEEAAGVVITPNRRNATDEPHGYRLIADDGYILTNGETEAPCVDTHEPDRWDEIEDVAFMMLTEPNAGDE